MEKRLIKALLLILLPYFLFGCDTMSRHTSHSHWLEPNFQLTSRSVYRQGNIWDDLRSTFSLADYSDKPQVKSQIRWFVNHQAFLDRMANRAAPYMSYIYAQVRERGLPTELVLLPIIESAYNPAAYSRVGAAGLWQFMPGTAAGFGLKENWWYDGRRDVFASTKAALDYVTYLSNFFDGDWLLALGAYDSGEGTVQNAVKRNQRRGLPTNFWSLHLPRETQAYVPRLLALAAIIAHNDRYGVDFPAIDDKPYFAVVDVGSQIDLAHAAKLAEISTKELYTLNPGYIRWATDPTGPYQLLIPVDKVETFKENLAKLPPSKRVTWLRYKIKRGDSLGKIASDFHTSVAMIKKVNKLHSDNIHVGKPLLIPHAKFKIANSYLARQLHYAHKQRNHVGPKEIIHTVRHGDTFESIAREYHVKAAELKFWNKKAFHSSALLPGTKIVMWKRRSSHGTHHSHYKVKPGDSLVKIAHTHHITVASLKGANDLANNLIHPGQTLLIPSPGSRASRTRHYSVKWGDSLYEIASHYHVSVKQIREWNHLKKGAFLHPGQRLIIYV